MDIGDTVSWKDAQGNTLTGIISALNDDETMTIDLTNADGAIGESVMIALAELTMVEDESESEDDAIETDDASKASMSPDDWAVVPNPKLQSTWKMPIDTLEHVSGAITALEPAGMDGEPVSLTPAERVEAIARISARIDALEAPDTWKKAQTMRLSLLKTPTIKSVLDMDGLLSLSIKSIGSDRFGGYAVLWGDEKHKDLQGDYFTAKTEYWLDAYPTLPALYNHGQDSTLKSSIIGMVQTIKPDVNGLWVEAQYNRRSQYVSRIQKMVADGILSWSSGSVGHLVKRRSNGEITDWPIVEISLTTDPAEPRGTDIVPLPAKHYVEERTIVSAFKSLGLSTEALGLSEESAPNTRQQSGIRANGTSKSAPVAITSRSSIKTKDSSTMEITKEELQRMVADSMKAERDSEMTLAKAKMEDDSRIEVRAKQLAVEMVAAKSAEKQLPAAPIENIDSKPAVKNAFSVVGPVKYASLGAEDMSYMGTVMAAIASAADKKQHGERNNTELMAQRWIKDVGNDPERKFQRELAAKSIKAEARGTLPVGTSALMPYKSLDDVDGNRYDMSAQKAAHDEIQAIKANELDNTAQTSFGLDWVPTIWNNSLWMRVRISNPYAANIQTIEMPSNPYKLPIESVDPTVFNIAEGTDAAMLVLTAGNTLPLSKVGSGAPVITAKKQGLRVGWSTELLEDSVLIPVIQNYRRQSDRVLYNIIDDTIANGDVQTGANLNVNLIDGTPTLGTSFLSFDGFRKYAEVTNPTQAINVGGALTLAAIRKMRRSLSRAYAVDIANLVFVMQPEVYFAALNIPEIATYLNLGAVASNVTGLLPGGNPDTTADTPYMVGRLDGVPVFVSAQIASSNAAGAISATPANNLYGTMTLHHKSRWYLGYRRNVSVDVFSLPWASDTYQLVATVRYGLVPFDTQSAVVGYNIAI